MPRLSEEQLTKLDYQGWTTSSPKHIGYVIAELRALRKVAESAEHQINYYENSSDPNPVGLSCIEEALAPWRALDSGGG